MFELSIQTKTYLVFGIMVGCFIILYPKIFHPMVLHLLGFNPPAQDFDDGLIHPRERAMRTGQKDTYHPHSRPHPGMRAERQTAKETSRGGGIMSMVLPIYAICIVLYLVYTLAKVFGQNNNSDISKNVKTKARPDPLMQEHYNNFDYCPGQEGFTMRSNQEEEDSEDDESGTKDENVEQWLKQPGSHNPSKKGGRVRPTRSRSSYTTEALRMKTLPSDLERLLKKVDDKNINEKEMRELRVRLEETERQMTQLLEAMRTAEDEPVSQNNSIPNEKVKVPLNEKKRNGKNSKSSSSTQSKQMSDMKEHSNKPTSSKEQPNYEDGVHEIDADDEDMEVVTASEGEEINEDNDLSSQKPMSLKTVASEDDECIENCGSELRARKIKH